MSQHAQRAAAWLRKWADEIEAQPERWTKNAWARDPKGVSVQANDSAAVCWCIRGAVWRDFLDPMKPLVIPPGKHFPDPRDNDDCQSAADMAALCRRAADQLDRQQ